MDKKPGAEGRAFRGIGWTGALFRQMRYRWQVFLLLALALCGIVTAYTYVQNSSRFHVRSMQLIVKETGHNLWFISESAYPFDAFTGSPELPTFPDERVHELAEDRRIASTYYANILQEAVSVRGRTVLLSGVERVDDFQVTEEKPHLLEELPPQHADIGYALARDWGVTEGDTLTLGERVYRIRTVYSPRGHIDDGRLWIPLVEAQEWLGKPGEANVIRGFLCMRGMSVADGLARLNERIAELYPDLQVVPQMNILEPRELARSTTSEYLGYLLLLMALIAVLLMAVVGLMEVDERRYELSIMLAMGANYPMLFVFFLGKLALLAIISAVAGFLLGSLASVHWLTPVLVTQTQPVAIVWADLPGIMLRTLVLVTLAAVAPLIYMTRLEPTKILAEE